MDTITCTCGTTIMLQPNISAMNTAINNHLHHHPAAEREAVTDHLITQLLSETSKTPTQPQTISGLYKWDFSGKNTFIEDVQALLKRYDGKNIKITVEELP